MAFSSPFRALGLALLLPTVALAQNAELNTITAVRVRGGHVEIVGSKKPNFTTFTMTDPSRLVIDISEAVFKGVPEDMQVGDGTISAIRTASYGSDSSAIARVLVGFEKDVETDIQAEGGLIVVKVLGAGGAAVAAGTPSSGGTEKAAAHATTGEAPGGNVPAANAEAVEQERLARQQAEAEAARAAEQERHRQEAEARAQADAKAKADTETRAQAEAQAKAETEERKRKENEARAQAEAEAARLEAEARAQAEAEVRAKADARAQARTEAEERKRQEAEARAQARTEAEERKRQESEARSQARAEAAARAQEEREADAQRRAEARAQAEERQTAPAEAQHSLASSGDVSGRRKTVALVGFKQEAGSSRVFVRTDEPVRYTVSEGGERTLVLELENTRIGGQNNRRALETSFFDTAVARVMPRSGPGRTVRVEITLKESVPYQATQEGNVVSLEFPRAGR